MKTSANLVPVSTQLAVNLMRRTCFCLGLVALVGLYISEVRATEQIFSPQDLWLPVGCGFASTDDTAVLFTAPGGFTIYVRQLHLTNFFSFPPPPIGATSTTTYNNIATTLEVSTNAINWSSSQGSGPTTIKLDH